MCAYDNAIIHINQMSFLNKVGKVIMFTSTKSVSHYWLIEIWMKNVCQVPV